MQTIIRKAFSVLELVFVIVILGIMATFSVLYIPQTDLQQATIYLINNLKYTKSLAQNDDRYYTMPDNSLSTNVDIASQMRYWQAGMWQLQFHTTGSDSKNSYSIYADTGRSAANTNFDGRPMAGDLIAKDATNQACLSGYTMSNLPTECKNNIAKEVKLEETYGVIIKKISAQNNCTTTNTFRIYFDKEGIPYCGNVNIGSGVLPKILTSQVSIELQRGKELAFICINTGGLIYGSKDGTCNK